ncbi:MAG: hypothetical protein PUB18_03305 [bacterium]|nr:hypothetical protein [bacterium]
MYVIIQGKRIPFRDSVKFLERFKGFMFVLKPIEVGLRFPKRCFLHTYFICQDIDIIMTDKNHKIIKLYPNFASERIIFPKRGVYYTYELPCGSIQKLKVGDILKVKEK